MAAVGAAEAPLVVRLVLVVELLQHPFTQPFAIFLGSARPAPWPGARSSPCSRDPPRAPRRSPDTTFTATCLPSIVSTRCTWPIDAAANASGSNEAKMSATRSPWYSSSSTSRPSPRASARPSCGLRHLLLVDLAVLLGQELAVERTRRAGRASSPRPSSPRGPTPSGSRGREVARLELLLRVLLRAGDARRTSCPRSARCTPSAEPSFAERRTRPWGSSRHPRGKARERTGPRESRSTVKYPRASFHGFRSRHTPGLRAHRVRLAHVAPPAPRGLVPGVPYTRAAPRLARSACPGRTCETRSRPAAPCST